MRMKKSWLFVSSIVLAIVFSFLSKKLPQTQIAKNSEWKTFEKKSNKETISHSTTSEELKKAVI